MTYYLRIVLEVSTRRVRVAGLTLGPDTAFVVQVGRNLTGTPSAFLVGKHYLIMDRDRKYSEKFREIVTESDANIVRLPPRSPKMNAYCERFVLRSNKSASFG